jgi:hypothetical protein
MMNYCKSLKKIKQLILYEERQNLFINVSKRTKGYQLNFYMKRIHKSEQLIALY